MMRFIFIFFSFLLSTSDAALEQTIERGPVSVKLSLSPEAPVIGDNLTLLLTVITEPNVELLMPEFGQALSRFSIVDFVPRQQLNAKGKIVASQKYTLVIPRSGEQNIPQLTIEFIDRRPGQRQAPEGEDAYEILTKTINFKVKSIAPKDENASLKAMLGELSMSVRKTEVTPQTPVRFWFIVGLCLLLVVVGGVWFWKNREIRRETAYERACRQINGLKGQPRPENAEDIERFFIHLSSIVRHYLEDRFRLHAPELTTEEFLEVASRSPDIATHRSFLKNFLAHADQVKFARLVPSAEDIKYALTNVDDFITQTKPQEKAND